jgi:ribosome-binding protein aMBF1 (putative translation factor)
MHQQQVAGLRAARAVLAGIAVTLACACATIPPESVALDDSRERYAAASDSPRIFDFAASSMRQAQHHLRRAEQLLEQAASQDELDHHSFLARQYVAIAEARLRRGLAQEDIEQAAQRRQALVLEYQQREAAAATQRAEAVEDELSDARMQLRMSERRARSLAERLVEMGVTDSVEPNR